ncbi:MAG: hypothetical protein PHX68_00475 [Alphaproteobacteria bacterium]|nr:hypothetical protein [Alphaproteobacteria bacterium]
MYVPYPYQDFYDRYYERRHEPDFLTESDNLVICLLFDIFSAEIVRAARGKWDRLPAYLHASIPKSMCTIIREAPENSNVQSTIDAWYVNRAAYLLKSYSRCLVPYSADGRVPAARVDLLSQDGAHRLAELTQALSSGNLTPEIVEKAFGASSRFFLDLDLFKDVDPVLDIRNPITQKTAAEESAAYLCLSASSGCHNACVHCGFNGCGPVSHMPYPLFSKLYRLFHQNSPPAAIQRYLDSDPLHYMDPIIGADAGDIALTLNAVYWNQLIPTTKGVLFGTDKAVLEKMYAIAPHIVLSHVALPGEPAQKNMRRLADSLDAVSKASVLTGLQPDSNPPPVVAVQTYGPPEATDSLAPLLARYADLNFIVKHRRCAPVGRAARLDASYLRDSEKKLMEYDSFLNIRANGDITWVNLEGAEYQHYTIGNVLEGPRHVARHKDAVVAAKTCTPNRCR